MSYAVAIETNGLGKSYGSTCALSEVDLVVPTGTVFALLGRNGAGKTTLVRALATLSEPSSGWARVAGWDVVKQRHQVRERTSLTGQFAALDPVQTGRENLEMIGRLRHLGRRASRARADQLLGAFELTGAAGRKVNTYSGGMRRRLDLAAGLVSRPEVVFLDEPTTGLDLPSRQAVWAAVTALANAGSTVLLTTQYLEEADRLAHTVAVLEAGRVVALGAPAELKRRVAARWLELTMTGLAAYDEVTTALRGRSIVEDRGQYRVTTAIDDQGGHAGTGDAGQVRALLDQVDPERLLICHFALREASLDDVFLALTGNAAANPASSTAQASPRQAAHV